MRFSKYSKTRGQYETLEARQLFAADLVGGAAIDLPDTPSVAGLESGDHQFYCDLRCGYGGPDFVQTIPDRMSVQGVLSNENGPVVTSVEDGGAVDHNSTRSNRGTVGEGGEQHKIYDYSQCIWNDITFNCHATPDARSDNLRGSVTVNFVNVRDQYQTDTCHVDEYGTVSMASKVDPDSKDCIDQVKEQYEGSRAGAKPNGAVILSDRSGNDTVNWNINGWHIENFSVDQVMSQLDDQEPEALKPEKAVVGHHDTALSITRKIGGVTDNGFGDGSGGRTGVASDLDTDNPEGSNPTPHPMPVPEFSDFVSKHRLEHGPGMYDRIWTDGTMTN
jgi:hypothetical protein